MSSRLLRGATAAKRRNYLHNAALAPWKGVSMVTWDHPDLNTLNVSWWYDWGHLGGDNTPSNAALYTPMVWGDPAVTNQGGGSIATIAGDYPTLLGFNEPDGSEAHQANVSVSRALELWPDLEATGARLGSPAVSAGAGALDWLADFMAGVASNELRVDFMAVHWYGTDVEELLAYLANIHTLYQRPIWITETDAWAFETTPTASQHATVAAAIITAVQDVWYVERVAWFANRVYTDVAGYANAHLIDGSGLTVVGDEWAPAANSITWVDGDSTLSNGMTGVLTHLPVAGLDDDFATLDEANWFSDGVDIDTGRARFDTVSGFTAFLSSRALWDLTDSAVSFEVTGLAGTDMMLFVARDERNQNQRIEVYAWQDDLALQGFNAGSSVQYGEITYNATDHRWLRLRHAGTTAHLDVSADGSTWTTSVLSITEATLGWTPDSVELVFTSGYTGTESTPRYVYLDNVNNPPS